LSFGLCYEILFGVLHVRAVAIWCSFLWPVNISHKNGTITVGFGCQSSGYGGLNGLSYFTVSVGFIYVELELRFVSFNLRPLGIERKLCRNYIKISYSVHFSLIYLVVLNQPNTHRNEISWSKMRGIRNFKIQGGSNMTGTDCV
jgi:hypothetical protein